MEARPLLRASRRRSFLLPTTSSLAVPRLVRPHSHPKLIPANAVRSPAVDQSDLDFLNATLAPPPLSTVPAPSPSQEEDDSIHPLMCELNLHTASLSQLSSSLPDTPDSNEAADDEEGDEDEMSEASMRDLLAKLSEADLAADGIESRLDELLGTLDGLLSGLEGLHGDKVPLTQKSEETDDKVEKVQ